MDRPRSTLNIFGLVVDRNRVDVLVESGRLQIIKYSSLNLPKNICQILDYGQECCLVTVLRQHLERISILHIKLNGTISFFYHDTI